MDAKSSSVRAIDAAGLGVCALLTAALYLVGVQPMLDRRAQLADAEAQLRARSAEAQQGELALSSARRQVVQAEQAVAANPLRLQPLERLNTWLAMIAETATESGVELDQLEPSGPTHERHFVTVPIRVVGRGPFTNTTRFLHALHEAMPDIAAPSMRLRGEPRSQEGSAAFEFDLLWHAAPVRLPAEASAEAKRP